MSSSGALISPKIDFLLVGGGSIIALGIFSIIRLILGDDYTQVVYFIGFVAATGSFFINQPHFAFSYQLFYQGFLKRIRASKNDLMFKWRTLLVGLLVPFFLIYYLVASMIISPESAKWVVWTMFFTVGWHYVKQGYGVLITLSVAKGMYFSLWQKRLLMLNCYAVWLYTWIAGNFVSFSSDYSGLKYERFTFDQQVIDLFGLISLTTTIATAVVLIRAWHAHRSKFSFNGVIGYFCAVYLWMGFANIDPAFFVVVPAFHSMQYFPFVYRFKASEHHGRKIPLIKFAVIGIVLGGIFMHYLPEYLDNLTFDFGYQQSFYLASFLLFINIHHYFIDHAFWRKENPAVQTFLFQKSIVNS
jgi:hypothetical protein